MKKRIISKIDIKGKHVVKSVHFDGLRVLGMPKNFAENYYLQNIDEIFLNDIVASLYQRNNNFDYIKHITSEIFVPVILGGGIRSLHDIEAALNSGADKVYINTHATKDTEFIKNDIYNFVASTIIIVIVEKLKQGGKYLTYTDHGRENTGKCVEEWASILSDMGVGEILINSIDRDGTGRGFDLNLIDKVSQLVNVPLIVAGGAGTLKHIDEVSNIKGVDAIALSSVLHYNSCSDFKTNENDYLLEGNIEYLLSGEKPKKINSLSVEMVKSVIK